MWCFCDIHMLKQNTVNILVALVSHVWFYTRFTRYIVKTRGCMNMYKLKTKPELCNATEKHWIWKKGRIRNQKKTSATVLSMIWLTLRKTPNTEARRWRTNKMSCTHLIPNLSVIFLSFTRDKNHPANPCGLVHDWRHGKTSQTPPKCSARCWKAEESCC